MIDTNKIIIIVFIELNIIFFLGLISAIIIEI
jgi:hypothetical protein